MLAGKDNPIHAMPPGEWLAGVLSAAKAIARQVAQGALRSPLPLLLVIMAVVACGYVHSQRSILEHDFSWPFEEMRAEAVATYSVPPSTDILVSGKARRMVDDYLTTPHDAAVIDYSVSIRVGNAQMNASAHALERLCPSMLDVTQYNAAVLEWERVGAQGVLIDSDLAANMGIRAGDTITLIQRLSDQEKQVVVSGIVHGSAGARGIIADESIMRDFIPLSVTLYFVGAPTRSLGGTVLAARSLKGSVGRDDGTARHVLAEFVPRDEQLVKQASLAAEQIPDEMNSLLKKASLVFLCAIGFFYVRLRLRQDRINILSPFEGFGMPWWGSSLGFVAGLLPCMILAIAIGLVVFEACVLATYHFSLAFSELVRLTLCDFGMLLISILLCLIFEKLTKNS